MKNKDMPAMPIELSGFGQFKPEAHIGLTKREMITMHVACSVMTSLNDGAHRCEWDYPSFEELAEQSVQYADALLKELEK
ncbi:coil containing protein [Vibrio phage 1.239.O._10N.261.52.F6]|nr:coil containing protein [Vibrio phage 1.239.O._10N.261.52.F6]